MTEKKEKQMDKEKKQMEKKKNMEKNEMEKKEMEKNEKEKDKDIHLLLDSRVSYWQYLKFLFYVMY